MNGLGYSHLKQLQVTAPSRVPRLTEGKIALCYPKNPCLSPALGLRQAEIPKAFAGLSAILPKNSLEFKNKTRSFLTILPGIIYTYS